MSDEPEQITEAQRTRRIARLREIVEAITNPPPGVEWHTWIAGHMTMRIPADPLRDADLVLSWAADELERRADLARLPDALVAEGDRMRNKGHDPKCPSFAIGNDPRCTCPKGFAERILAWHEQQGGGK